MATAEAARRPGISQPSTPQPSSPAGDAASLLREMRHRNDNALQLVVSLLRLRLARLEAATAASLTPIVDEIESLVRAQAHLNRHPGAARIARHQPRRSRSRHDVPGPCRSSVNLSPSYVVTPS